MNTMAKKLMVIAIIGKGTETEINELEKQAKSKILETAKGINADWYAATTIRETGPIRIQKGTIKRNMAENETDMLEGAMNRMHITDDKDEFTAMLNGALYHIHALSQLALDKIGTITIPEFEWRCNLKL